MRRIEFHTNHSIVLMLAAASLVVAPCNAQESGQRLHLNMTSAPGSRTIVVTLGTGSPPADPNRYGPATAIIVDSSVYLFDSGVGVVRRWAAAIRKDIGSARSTCARSSSHTFTPITRLDCPS